jgi:aminoglycoside phosphotransferase (APT) family kinase protein
MGGQVGERQVLAEELQFRLAMQTMREERWRLASWLQKHIPESSGIEIGYLRPANVGNSAETLLFDVTYVTPNGRRCHELVLRKEMSGTPVFLDCSIRGQAEMMTSLRRHGVPTAPVIGWDEDSSIVGAHFLIMERVAGRAFPAVNYNVGGWVFELPRDQQSCLWRNAVDVLGRLNRLDWRDGFRMLDRRQYGSAGLDQYLGWLRAWRAQANGGAPHLIIDPAMDYLEGNRPNSTHVNLLWGDSNPGNMLFADDLSIAAVLDFEAAALGPAEIDLGYWMFMDERRSYGLARLPGLLDRAATISTYEASLGRAVENLPYYEILAGVRMSVIIVRTVDRLVELGRLPATNQAGTCNPIAAVLARKLSLEPPETGKDFEEFSRAVTLR